MHNNTLLSLDFNSVKKYSVENPGRAILQQLTVRKCEDDIADLSWLETEYDEDTQTIIKSDRYSNKDVDVLGWDTVLGHIKQDEKRLNDFGRTWRMIGVQATGIVYIPTGHEENISFKLQAINSGGLWGIDTDSEAGYINSVGDMQVSELFDYLKILNVYIPDEAKQLERVSL